MPEDMSRPPIVVAGVPYRRESGKAASRFGDIFGGSENVPELTELQSHYTYRKMRRSDPTVSAVLRSIELPIRQATYDVAPPVNPNKLEEDQTKYIADWLFERLNWGQTIRSAVTCLTYGFSVMEKVYDRSKGKIVPKKLAFRPQSTLIDEKRNSTGEVISIIQQVDGSRIDLPREKVILFTIDSESPADWRGQSLLRSAYKPWYIKERIEIITGIAHERFTAGIPYLVAPDGVKEGDDNWKAAEKALENLHAGAYSRVIIPFGWQLLMFERKSQPMDPVSFIKELKDDIKTAPLALHLRLGGNDTSGSKALGVTFVDSFLHGVQAWGDLLCESFNEDLVKDLVHQNWGRKEGQRYPKVILTNVYKSALKELAYLVQVGIIIPTEELVKYVLEQYGIRIDPSKVKPGMGNQNKSNNNDNNDNNDNKNKNGNNDNNKGGNDGN